MRKHHYITVMLIVCILISGASTSVFAASKVTFGNACTTVDTFNGVSANYKEGNHNTDTTYSCAALVKRYYKQIFGVDVYNLTTGCTPKAHQLGYSFKKISAPQVMPGDIGYQTNSRGGGHWFIIKSVNGNELTIIEQNWKSGNTAPVDRVVTFGKTANLKAFRLYKDGADMNPGAPLTELQFGQHENRKCV